MKLYYVPQGSCYIRIVRVKYRNDRYIKAKIQWYSKGSLKLITEENNVKIPLESFNNWRVYESDIRI